MAYDTERPGDLIEDLRVAINRNSAENGSNTADHILAGYLYGCLAAFDNAVTTRDRLAPDTNVTDLQATIKRLIDQRDRAQAEHAAYAQNATTTVGLMHERIAGLEDANHELQNQLAQHKAALAELRADHTRIAEIAAQHSAKAVHDAG